MAAAGHRLRLWVVGCLGLNFELDERYRMGSQVANSKELFCFMQGGCPVRDGRANCRADNSTYLPSYMDRELSINILGMKATS